jgi:dCTP deaminase
MILNDIRIIGRAAVGMITPFVAHSTKGPGGTSFGLSSFGYDVRVGREWVEYRTNNDVPLDPSREITEEEVRRTTANVFVLRPNSFVLAHTMEILSIPRDCLGLVKDKSSLARLGITLQTTVLEPGWTGQVTLEIYNNNPRPVLLRAGQGIAQILFETGDPCYVSYADRKGKYQGQSGVTLPRSSGEVAA